MPTNSTGITSISKAIIKLHIQHWWLPSNQNLHYKDLTPPTIEQSPDEHLPGAQLHKTVERLEGDERGYQAGQRRLPRPPWPLKLPFLILGHCHRAPCSPGRGSDRFRRHGSPGWPCREGVGWFRQWNDFSKVLGVGASSVDPHYSTKVELSMALMQRKKAKSLQLTVLLVFVVVISCESIHSILTNRSLTRRIQKNLIVVSFFYQFYYKKITKIN